MGLDLQSSPLSKYWIKTSVSILGVVHANKFEDRLQLLDMS